MATLMNGNAEDSLRAGNSPRPKGRGKSWTEDFRGSTLEVFILGVSLLMVLARKRECKGHSLQERHNLWPLSL